MKAAFYLGTILYLLPGFSWGQKLLPPEQGIYHGAYTDSGPLAQDVTVEAIQRYETLAQKKITWAYFSNDWIDGVIAFPWESARQCERAGVIPYIRMMPWSTMKPVKKADPIFTMARILRGDFDASLREWAQDAIKFNKPLLVEFGPEANGQWFPWNARWNGGARTRGYKDPRLPDGAERFRDAYRHIIRLFRKEGVKNITWVLHLDTAPWPDVKWNRMKYYDPGPEYVDWIGLSVFGAQLPNHKWLIFSQKLSRKYAEVLDFAKGRPIMISEFGVIERKKGQKARWLGEALKSLNRQSFPEVKGIAYWHSPGWLPRQEAPFYIDSSAEALKAYRRGVASPGFISQPVFSEPEEN